MQAFDLIRAPLDGSTLLEAGAGTGKTFSLSFLYLRLLLEQALSVEEIVVATFTNAATAELKARIYERLLTAEQTLHQIADDTTLDADSADADSNTGNNTDTDDNKDNNADDNSETALLSTLLRGICRQIGIDTVRKRLRLAQVCFDRAQIHSINGFALHLLREQAVTLNTYVPETILDDDNARIKAVYLQLAHDNFADLGDDADAVGAAVATLSSQALFDLLTAMHNHYDALKNGEAHFPDCYHAEQQTAALVQQVTAPDFDRDGAVAEVLAAIDNGFLTKTSYKAEKVHFFAEQLPLPAAYDGNNHDFLLFFSRQRLLQKCTKKGQAQSDLFEHPLFVAFDTLVAVSKALAQRQPIAFYHCLMKLLDVIRTRLVDDKAEQMAMTHDDVVRVTAAGAERLNMPFKAALLDEAQDTNADQLRLFEKLFVNRGHSCFFVGDPKQAIYGFRGGDVYTYLNIRQRVTRACRLPTNYRSSQALNTAVNTLFAANPFADSGIDYHPVATAHDDSGASFAETSTTLIDAENKSVSHLAEVAARHLVALLQQGHTLTDKHGQRPLQSRDIAVLVRGKTQAAHMKTALANLGLAASYTGKSSVYDTDEALLFYALLQAVSSGDARHVRALMLTPLLADSNVDGNVNGNVDNGADDSADNGIDNGADNCVNNGADRLDEARVNALCRDLHDFAALYEQRGFALMFYRLMHRLGIAARLLALADGKRRLSNWMQLFELAQQALQSQSRTLLGLNDWLLQRIKDHDAESELRLEDQNAISILTMHSAKGLEFNVVCLPFFHYQANDRTRPNAVQVSHQAQLAALTDLHIEAIEAQCRKEENAEAMRLAYVALTRAVYQNIVVLQPAGGQNKSRDSSVWARLVKGLAQAVESYPFVDTVAENSDEHLRYHAEQQTPLTLKSLQTALNPTWVLSSFSGLQHITHAYVEATLAALPTADITADMAAAAETTASLPTSALMHFAAGPKAGTALHTLYEHYMQHRRCDTVFIQTVTAVLADAFANRKLSDDSTADAASIAAKIAAAIADTAAVALSPQPFCLNDIDTHRQSIEMGFFLHLSPSARQYLYQQFGVPMTTADIDGYLHGFIDYWFEHDGRYYVLDYKSNRLGEHIGDYNRQAMQAEMNAHRYDLQALIYTVALCKHLGITTAEDYETRFGGYYYLFIRGMNTHPETADNGIYYDCIPWSVLKPLIVT